VPRTSPAPRLAQRFSAWRLFLQLCVFPLFASALFSAAAQAQTSVVLVGSGSSVPAPLYTRWTQEYGKRDVNIQIRYLPIGTSEGINEISRGASDFGAGEAQLTAAQRKEGSLTALPVVLIGIVLIYNLPDLRGELRLSGDVLAGIFLGEVNNWNAPQIAKLNPDVPLPNLAIKVINRPAGKGSNYVFTEFLSKVNAKFRTAVGVSASPKWPVGEAAERSSDVADKVKNTPGSIGYVEYQYALKANIPQAAVLNQGGRFVKASMDTIVAACDSAEQPRWNNFSASLTYAPGAESYPITSFTWIYLRTTAPEPARAAALTNLLDWIYNEGQRSAALEGYSALPAELLAEVRKKATALR
jgi:phosphate transport system substrate-binding protein